MKDRAKAGGPTQPPQRAEVCPDNSGFQSSQSPQPSSFPFTYSAPSKRSLALQMLRDRGWPCGIENKLYLLWRLARENGGQGKRAKWQNGIAKEGAEEWRTSVFLLRKEQKAQRVGIWC